MSNALSLQKQYSQAIESGKSWLIRRSGNYKDISKASGINLSWISKFVNGKIEAPSVDRLTQLHTFISSSAAKKFPASWD